MTYYAALDVSLRTVKYALLTMPATLNSTVHQESDPQ